jgi:serine/threonine-protein kinase
VAEEKTLSPGALLEDKYRIVRFLGSGGMGAVYECEHLRLGRRVAIKVLRSTSRQSLSRFEREARAAARVGSLHIVDVIDFGELPTEQRFIVMEHLDGQTLHARLIERGSRMDAAELLPIVADLLHGLSDAHEAGIVHRDLKPDNVFLAQVRKDEGELVKILDFGVSKVRDEEARGVELTATGMVLGTPRFMSPEQARGLRDVDGRTDIYSVGVILFRCLSGEYPFQSATVDALIPELLSREAPLLSEVHPAIDGGLTAIVSRALSRRPADRFQSAEEMRAALLGWLERHGHALSAFKRRGARPSQPAPTQNQPPTEPADPGELADPAAGLFGAGGEATLSTAELGPLPTPQRRVGRWVIAATAGLALGVLLAQAVLRDQGEAAARVASGLAECALATLDGASHRETEAEPEASSEEPPEEVAPSDEPPEEVAPSDEPSASAPSPPVRPRPPRPRPVSKTPEPATEPTGRRIRRELD